VFIHGTVLTNCPDTRSSKLIVLGWKVNNGDRGSGSVAVSVADVAELGDRVIDGPGRREAAGWRFDWHKFTSRTPAATPAPQA
jgi:hypothetical protein